MDNKIRLAVKKIVNEIMSKESPQLSKNRSAVLDKSGSFMESLEVDSLLALEIVSKIEKVFGVQLKEEDFVYFDTMDNIAQLIERKILDKEGVNNKAKKTSVRKKRVLSKSRKNR